MTFQEKLIRKTRHILSVGIDNDLSTHIFTKLKLSKKMDGTMNINCVNISMGRE